MQADITWREGHCGETAISYRGRCDVGTQGSFPLFADEAENETSARETCVARCRSCSRCRVISVSRSYRDCSWYASACDVTDRAVPGFVTGTVSKTHGGPPAASSSSSFECGDTEDDVAGHKRPLPEPTATLLCSASSKRATAECRRGRCKGAYSGDAFRLCGCSARYPEAQEAYSARLRQWEACTPQLGPESFATRGLVRLIPAPERSAASHAQANHASSCLSRRCVARRVASKWVMFVGDSTQRMVHDGFLALLRERYGLSTTTAGPFMQGWPVVDKDSHKDYDTIAMPAAAGEAPHGFGYTTRAVGREGAAARAVWANSSSGSHATLVSFRFLRGLDLFKLDLNSRGWRERMHYPEWETRSAAEPPNAVYGADAWTADELTRQALADRPAPDALVFHSCAWDLPVIKCAVGARPKPSAPCVLPSCSPSRRAHHDALTTTRSPRHSHPVGIGSHLRSRSSEYYPTMLQSRPCPRMPTRMEVQAAARPACRSRACLARADLSVPSTERTLHVPVHGAPCVRRGLELTDEQIVHGFRDRLREALRMLRARFTGRLIVRNCHTGTQSSVLERRDGLAPADQPQRAALRRMNAVIDEVARELCIEVIDAWALDELAGDYVVAPDKEREDFHVPEPASTHAALAVLLSLRLGV